MWYNAPGNHRSLVSFTMAMQCNVNWYFLMEPSRKNHAIELFELINNNNNNNLVWWHWVTLSPCHTLQNVIQTRSASHVSLTNYPHPSLRRSFHLAEPHSHIRKYKYGRILTIMPWTTTDEFNVIPKTQWMSLTSFPRQTSLMRYYCTIYLVAPLIMWLHTPQTCNPRSIATFTFRCSDSPIYYLYILYLHIT